MATEYNGKYPNRIESVWRVSEKFDAKRPWMFRTNIGSMYTFKPSGLMISPSDLLGQDYSTIPTAEWVDNSTKRIPGKRWRSMERPVGYGEEQ